MKKHILTVILAVFLLLTGCAPATQSAEPWDRNVGTTASNILMAGGKYAMANGFVYIDRHHSIVEYDMESGKSVALSMPRANTEVSDTTSRGNLFLLQNGLTSKQHTADIVVNKKPDGTVDSKIIHSYMIGTLHPDGGKTTPLKEFGTGINHFVPMKKQLPSDYEPDPTNPLAGLEFYYSATYDSFPEVAAQLAVDGITLPEPEDPEERNRYFIPALFHYDGDAGKSTIIERDFIRFFVDDANIYIVRDVKGVWEMYRSDRQKIDFQPLGIGAVGNKFCSYDGTLALIPADVKKVCLYKDGQLTELPITSTTFILLRDKIVYVPIYNVGAQPQYSDLLMYDLLTGTTETISQNASYDFAILEDRYVAYRELSEEYETDILYDIETGERIEMYQTEVQ